MDPKTLFKKHLCKFRDVGLDAEPITIDENADV